LWENSISRLHEDARDGLENLGTDTLMLRYYVLNAIEHQYALSSDVICKQPVDCFANLGAVVLAQTFTGISAFIADILFCYTYLLASQFPSVSRLCKDTMVHVTRCNEY
jgi:hypothetical protein